MRRVIVPQMKLGELAIANIKFDPESRDDIPQILRGLQHIYTTPELRGEIFAILQEVLPERQIEGKTVKVDSNNGRPGMTQWQILVLRVLRLGLNADYDHILKLTRLYNLWCSISGNFLGMITYDMYRNSFKLA